MLFDKKNAILEFSLILSRKLVLNDKNGCFKMMTFLLMISLFQERNLIVPIKKTKFEVPKLLMLIISLKNTQGQSYNLKNDKRFMVKTSYDNIMGKSLQKQSHNILLQVIVNTAHIGKPKWQN